MMFAKTLASTGIFCLCALGPGCAFETGDPEGLPSAEESVASSEFALTYPGDQSVTMHVVRYDCGLFLDPSYCDQGDEVLGLGGTHLRAIDNAEKTDIFMSFPNGHPSNPSTIVFITTGNQTGSGEPDALTGQAGGYKWNLTYRAKSNQRTLSGNSLYGRLLNLYGTNGVYYILVHDNAANWGDGDSEFIHHQFAKYVAAKVGLSTKRIVVAGYSRGGYMAAHMVRSFRDGVATVPTSVNVYAAAFDPVSGGGGGFGVDTNNYKDNPLVSDDNYKKEQTNCWNQIGHTNRQNSTFFFSVVGGEPFKLGELNTGVHAFGCGSGYSIFPSYWNESWVTNAHGNWKSSSYNAETIDPFVDWLVNITSSAESGTVRANAKYQYLSQGQSKDFHLPARAGGSISFRTQNDAGQSADLDIAVYDASGAYVCGGYSWSTTDESVSCTAPSGGTYKVTVTGYSGAAQFSYSAQAAVDKTATGFIVLPKEKLNARSGYAREYNMAGTGPAHPISLELRWADPSKDLDLFLYDCSSNLLASSKSTRAMESINYRAPAGGCYRVRVSSNTAADSEYSLTGFAPLYNSTN